MCIYYNYRIAKHYFIMLGYQSIVQALLDKGVNVDCIDNVRDYIETCIFIIITG